MGFFGKTVVVTALVAAVVAPIAAVLSNNGSSSSASVQKPTDLNSIKTGYEEIQLSTSADEQSVMGEIQKKFDELKSDEKKLEEFVKKSLQTYVNLENIKLLQEDKIITQPALTGDNNFVINPYVNDKVDVTKLKEGLKDYKVKTWSEYSFDNVVVKEGKVSFDIIKKEYAQYLKVEAEKETVTSQYIKLTTDKYIDSGVSVNSGKVEHNIGTAEAPNLINVFVGYTTFTPTEVNQTITYDENQFIVDENTTINEWFKKSSQVVSSETIKDNPNNWQVATINPIKLNDVKPLNCANPDLGVYKLLSNEELIKSELARIDGLTLQLKTNQITQETLNTINDTNLKDQILDWDTNVAKYASSGIVYKVVEFKKENNTFKFKIEISKDTQKELSKEFSLAYEVKTLQELINAEVGRIENVNLQLKQEKYTDAEIAAINDGPKLIEQIKNWTTDVATNSEYKYEIVEFKNESSTSEFQFKVKVTSTKGTQTATTANLLKVKYVLKTAQDLVNEEVTRIDGMKISLKKDSLTQGEITKITEANVHELVSNWADIAKNTTEFDYSVVEYKLTNPDSKTPTLEFKVKVTSKKDGNVTKNSVNFVSILTNTDVTALEAEINRIKEIKITLSETSHTANEWNDFNNGTFNGIIANWNDIAKNNNEFDYLIENYAFDQANSKVTFSIKVTKKNTTVTQSYNTELPVTITTASSL